AAEAAEPEGESRIGWLVPFAAGLVGFAFLLMELVWYRMLAPLLGGSVYTFGLILAVALLGIGLGGLLYGAGESRRRPTMLTFAATCSLEALLMALPFAMGDRVAVLAAMLRPLGGSGFASLVGAWSAITALVVLPAAIVAGYQFPLLIALLGEGRRRVGREVGVTYAANTLGAILGSIAGGFGLIPLLSAPGVWRLVVGLLLGLALLTVVAGLRAGAPRRAAFVPVAAGALGLLFCLATGPTAFWRHSPIGAGRVETAKWTGPNDIRRSIEDLRRRVVWEADGVESSVALDLTMEYAFIVNGKADGSTLGDSPTQVMSGLVGAALHPNPKRVLVIGLGTGSTAGWLARIPSIERVDVVELEPAIEHVAEVMSKVNLDVMSNPKVHHYAGDGREFLLTTRERYDVVFSEPSNPYRAGIASLFSQDFYRAAVGRLRPGGIFLQWLQGYEMDAHMLRTAYGTLTSVFPSVETWQIHYSDLLLIATAEPLEHDFDRVRARMAGEPYRTALARTWGVEGAEGFYAGYLAAPSFARAVGEAGEGQVNTDDRPVLEFGFAKSLGRLGLFDIASLLDLIRSRGEHRPAGRGAPLDWNRVGEMQVAVSAYAEEVFPDPDPRGDRAARLRIAARHAAARDQLRQACGHWLRQPEPPRIHTDTLLVAECLAEAGHPRLPQAADWLAGEQPIEADMVRARWHFTAGRLRESTDHLLAAFRAYRQDPWVYRPLVRRTLPLAIEIARRDRAQGARLYDGLAQSFSTDMLEQLRRLVRVWVARELRSPRLCVEAFAPLEPHPPWDERVLAFRYECYRDAKSPLVERAREALETYRSAVPPSLAAGL
ncbi:MAG TPA: fused MFS/spermidine synthase, partial [Thermoanaerobaculia bacterium]|nr:fused MFS/spermidine synthase [Thermoanaerobaculia bacterium]